MNWRIRLAYRGPAPKDADSGRCTACGNVLDPDAPELSLVSGRVCMSCYGRAPR